MNQLVLAFFLLSVHPKAIVLPGYPPRPYTITKSTQAVFARLPQNPARDRVIKDNHGLSRAGNRFALQLTNGRQVRLISKPGSQFEVNMAELNYQGKLPYLHKYLLQVGQWESSITLMIDQRTGRIDTLQGPPRISPGLQRLAILFQNYPMGDGANGVDVYTVQQGKAQRQFRIEQDKWVPYGLAWLNDRSFILKCLPIAVEGQLNSTADRQRVVKRNTQFFYLQVTSR